MEKRQSGTSNKSNKSSERFLDRILYRFKMIKHSSRSHIENPTQQTVEYLPPVVPNTESTEEEEINNEYQYDWSYRRISPDDLQPFCEQLGKFLQYVRNIQDLTYLTFDYPCVLQNRLERDANELDSLYKEVRAAVVNIDRIKKQRKAVRKEKSSVKKTLKRLRDEESREMESILQVYDKSMYQRWESLKNCHNSDLLENLLNDVKSKQQALDNLGTLITRKLGNIQFFAPIPCPDIMVFGNDRATTTTGPSGTADRPTLTTFKRQQINNSNISRCRRRRHDGSRAQDNVTTTVKIVGSQNTDTDMSLVPFPITSGPSSNHSLSSTNSNTWSRSTDNNNNGSNNVTEFQTEMRSVLQALFGDARNGQGVQTPPPITTITIDDDIVTTASSNTTNTDTNNAANNQAIELFAIRRPPTP